MFIFVLFTFQFKWQIHNLNNINWKCIDGGSAWDSNPGRQDGRRRRIHWAIAAPQFEVLLNTSEECFYNPRYFALKLCCSFKYSVGTWGFPCSFLILKSKSSKALLNFSLNVIHICILPCYVLITLKNFDFHILAARRSFWKRQHGKAASSIQGTKELALRFFINIIFSSKAKCCRQNKLSNTLFAHFSSSWCFGINYKILSKLLHQTKIGLLKVLAQTSMI